MKSFLNEGYFIDRPPMLNGSNYTYWKIRMKIFIQAHDYRLWRIMVDGLHTPKVLKDRDKEIVQLNAKAINMLYCSLDINKFNLVSSCILVKEFWEKLEAIYEGASKKETSSSHEEKEAHPNLCLMAYENEKKKKKRNQKKRKY